MSDKINTYIEKIDNLEQKKNRYINKIDSKQTDLAKKIIANAKVKYDNLYLGSLLQEVENRGKEYEINDMRELIEIANKGEYTLETVIKINGLDKTYGKDIISDEGFLDRIVIRGEEWND